MPLRRSFVVVAALAAAMFCSTAPALAQPVTKPGGTMPQTAVAGLNDFDFLIGQWKVHHRRLKERLANNHEWIEFDGSAVVQKILGGHGTFDDNVINLPEGPYHGASLRSFDVKTGQWSIWWLDERAPLGPIDPPVRGRFENGVGTFYAEEMMNGRLVRVRFRWSAITPTTCRWDQAFSIDGGATWETNWEMDFTRT